MAMSTIEKLRERVREVGYIREAIHLMEWDLQTGAPKKGHGLRSEAIGSLAGREHELSTAKEVGQWLEELSGQDVFATLSEVDQALVRVEKKSYDLMHNIPQKLYGEYQQLVSHAQSVWEDAKAENDFAKFQPYLERVVDTTKEFIGYWGYALHPYDSLLDQYEPGMTVRHIDEVFGQLRRELVPLVDAIRAKGPTYDEAVFAKQFPLQKQQAVNRIMLERIGFDFSAGRLDTTVHPFESTLNRYDVRVTTHYDEADIRETLFSTIHEGGHALYELGVSEELIGTTLSQGTSMGIHESQSRFWENMIGRSLPFWQHNYSVLVDAFPEVFASVDIEQFYRYINHVQPSLIRTQSDEVTYNLHIMVRYELEKAIFAGDLKVADLPGAWREKMQEYLGVVPHNDATGVLQDVHWSAGLFGYFPSYALGNLYAAQFYNTIQQAIPDLTEVIQSGDLSGLREWLRLNIHQYGKMLEPNEIIMKVTGEPLSGQYLVRYLNDKYRPIYGL